MPERQPIDYYTSPIPADDQQYPTTTPQTSQPTFQPTHQPNKFPWKIVAGIGGTLALVYLLSKSEGEEETTTSPPPETTSTSSPTTQQLTTTTTSSTISSTTTPPSPENIYPDTYYNPLTNIVNFDQFSRTQSTQLSTTNWNLYTGNTNPSDLTLEPLNQYTTTVGTLTGENALTIKNYQSSQPSSAIKKLQLSTLGNIIRWEFWFVYKNYEMANNFDSLNFNVITKNSKFSIKWIKHDVPDQPGTDYGGTWYYFSNNNTYLPLSSSPLSTQELTCNCSHINACYPDVSTTIARKYDWLYARIDIDLHNNKYRQFQCADRIWNLSQSSSPNGDTSLSTNEIGFVYGVNTRGPSTSPSYLFVDSDMISGGTANSNRYTIKRPNPSNLPIPYRPLAHIHMFNQFSTPVLASEPLSLSPGLLGWSNHFGSTNQITNLPFRNVSSLSGNKALTIYTDSAASQGESSTIKRWTWIWKNRVRCETYFAFNADTNTNTINADNFGELSMGYDIQIGIHSPTTTEIRKFLRIRWSKSTNEWMYTSGFEGNWQHISYQTLTPNTWHYLRWDIDLSTQKYIDLQCDNQTTTINGTTTQLNYTCSGCPPALSCEASYLNNLINLQYRVKTAVTGYKSYLFVDSIMISSD